jgi:hypothetical protein
MYYTIAGIQVMIYQIKSYRKFCRKDCSSDDKDSTDAGCEVNIKVK